MSGQAIIARDSELKILDRLYNSPQAEFLAVYGRRRIGKTYLISEYFKNKGYYFELTGTKDAPLKAQLNNFREEFADTFWAGIKQGPPQNWQEAFDQLRRKIQTLDQNTKVILFFDELPWLASPRSDILKSLEHAWNRYLSRMQNVILIVCGSSASWMLKKIIYNKGGLHGRLTAEIQLKPFTIAETEVYLKAKNVILDKKQMIELYLAFGGVAKYLNHVLPSKSSAQIINEICFQNNGALTLEFPKLFDSLFENSQLHILIVSALANKKSGMTRSELQQATGISSGGGFARILNELENSAFILACNQFSHIKKETKYRLIDEYSLFYLSWIKPAMQTQLKNINPNYWLMIQNSPSYLAWAGYAFEGVCLKHVDRIIDALKISVVARAYSSWTFKTNDLNTAIKGAQIDLIIDRNDNCINLCEIKFTNDVYTIDKAYAENLRYKKSCFQTQTKTKKSLFMTLITTFGANVNPNYLACVDEQITMDVLFDLKHS